MFSLRVKLVIAIGAIVSMASFPLIWMGYRDVYDHSIEAARERFVSLSSDARRALASTCNNGAYVFTSRSLQ